MTGKFSVLYYFIAVGEDPKQIQKILHEIESRWKDLVASVENQKRNVQLQVDADRLRCEKDALELILTSHCRWMKSTERLLQERKPDECRKLAEQCKVSIIYVTFI